ncbi:MAG: T9SS type A sorting domain-containing protein [Pedobacter sp.]|nr:T9SS type A sorting domain-containing protein [Pedobacter sp.]
MKRFILNPHLMLMGFFTLIVVSSGTSAKAQVEKKINQSIIIKNGDTIINGKKLSEADQEERMRLRKEFKAMEGRIKGKGGSLEKRVIIKPKDGIDKEIIISRKGDAPHVLHWEDGDMNEFEFDFKDKMPGGLHVFKFNGDSSMSFNFDMDTIMKEFSFQMDGLDSNLRKRIITMHRNMAPGAPGTPRMPRMPRAPMHPAPPMAFEFERGEFPGMRNRNNSSSFNFNSTDKNGISSRMNIRLSDAEKTQLKTITGLENTENLLDVKDLTLFPNFSNGKLGISFNLESKGPIKLKILNTDLKPLFTDELSNFNGSYMKQIPLAENGVYYITIEQNKVWFIKRLVKE